MRINYFLSIINDNFNLETEIKDYLSQGDIVKGKIVDMDKELVLLEIEGYGIIEAQTDINFPDLVDKPLNFVVSNIEDNFIKLKPIFSKYDSHTIQKKEVETDIYGEILEEYKLIDNNVSRKIIKNIFEFNLPITKENIITGLKAYNKLERLYYKDEDEKVILIEDQNIVHNNNEVFINYEGNNIDYKKINILKFLIVKNNQYPIKEDLSFIFENLLLEFPKSEVNNELIKILTYFIKKDIDITVNNIENFYKFIENPEKFINSLKKDIDSLISKNLIGLKRFNLNFSNSSIEKFQDYYKELQEELIKLKSIIKKSNLSNEKNLEKFREIGRKLDFLDDMNRKLALFYIPIKIGHEKHSGLISVFSKNKKTKNLFKNLSIYIKLNMANLGDVKIYCEFNNRNVNIRFNIEDKEINRFRENENLLKELLNEKGYNIKNINYKRDKKLNLLDTLVVNDKKIYYLDVQV